MVVVITVELLLDAYRILTMSLQTEKSVSSLKYILYLPSAQSVYIAFHQI